jgi:hypothetical protein
MGLQSCKSPNFGNFGTPKWESWDKMRFGCQSCGQSYIYYKGKVVASPKFGPWWVLWVYVCPWFIHAPKCSKYALTNLLFGLCKTVWVIELLIILPSPSRSSNTPFYPQSVTTKERTPTFFLSDVFTFGLVVKSIKELKVASLMVKTSKKNKIRMHSLACSTLGVRGAC